MHSSLLATLALAFPLVLGQQQIYGSPGTVSMSSFGKTASIGKCGTVDLKGNSAIRLPSQYMGTNEKGNCGRTMTVYFTPRFDDIGLATPPVLTDAVGVVADVCTECASWEAMVDAKLYKQIYPEAKAGEKTWGPALAFD